MSMSRRQFLAALATLSSTLASPQVFSALNSAQSSALSSARNIRAIASTGEKIPAIGLGSWLSLSIDFSDEQALASRVDLIREFLNLGGGMLDSSPMYGTAQKVIGHCLKRIGHHKGLFSATKVWTRGNREGSLQMEDSRLLWGLPSLDLMQVHNLLDWETHLPTLHEMKKTGDIRYVGVTTSHGRRHEKLMHIMKTQSLDFVQFTYNMLDREAEQYLLPMAKDKGIAVIINRPFQRGGLFEKVKGHALPSWASEFDCQNWAQFFLKFILSHDAVTCAIPATSKVAHLRENMAAAYGQLPDEAMRKKMLQHVNNL